MTAVMRSDGLRIGAALRVAENNGPLS